VSADQANASSTSPSAPEAPGTSPSALKAPGAAPAALKTPGTPSTAKPIIVVEGLKAAYGARVILENVSFQVRSGEVFVILGGSGCGKSTLLKHMIGLYPPAAGRVLMDGDDISQAFGEERRSVLRKIGVAYQSVALFGSMTALENVRLPLEELTTLPREADDLLALMKLKLVGLKEFAGLIPSELSGGMIKRAAIARALALDPSVVFLDEPSAGLDPVTSAEVDELIVFLARSLGITFVIVSHELASIDAIADRVIMLDLKARGIIAEGTPARLRAESTDPRVQAFFNRRPEK
jgi:phospholipid/cholesterol/gamma-HCH transport system ATP-binding protein